MTVLAPPPRSPSLTDHGAGSTPLTLPARRSSSGPHRSPSLLARSLDPRQDAELAKIATTESSLEHEVAALEAQVQKTLLEAKKVENTIFSTLGEQMAVEKGTQNTAKCAAPERAMRAHAHGTMAAACGGTCDNATAACDNAGGMRRRHAAAAACGGMVPWYGRRASGRRSGGSRCALRRHSMSGHGMW
jgi:hypothetical protein